VHRTFITGASLVLPDQLVRDHTLVVEGSRIVDLISGPRVVGHGEERRVFDGQLVVPGFVDVHVHGANGIDVMDGPGSVAGVARALPRWGVTSFCPTSIACTPERLSAFLSDVASARVARDAGARVLPAHLESNFISPDFRGAQPLGCLRRATAPTSVVGFADSETDTPFSSADILAIFARARPEIGIVTLAPEIDGGLDLVRALVAAGTRVSLGHSGATFEQAREAIAAGASHATHLFNRMSPMTHRAPGLVGAVLSAEELAAEIICDGHHVHPAAIRVAVNAKGTSRMMAITDGTAGSGLPIGARARLGGQAITVAEVARLDDGTMAGSVLTMDRAFAQLVTQCGFDVVQAATMCSTTPASELNLHGHGTLSVGAIADFVVLGPRLDVVETWIDGRPAWGGAAALMS
jgi:N-acetylglucosamine-6-phosphate deacetylase